MSVEAVGPLPQESAAAVEPGAAPPVGVRVFMLLCSVVGFVFAAAVGVLIKTAVFRGTGRK